MTVSGSGTTANQNIKQSPFLLLTIIVILNKGGYYEKDTY